MFCCNSDKKLGNLSCCDFGLIKIGIIAFALMIAKLWPPLLSLEWYWYAIIFVLVIIQPVAKMLKK
jgi:hypothetical protein